MLRRGCWILLALWCVSCASAGTPSPAQIEAQARAARASEPAGDRSSAASPPAPPRDPKVRHARARAALPPADRAAAVVVDPADAPPYALVLATLKKRDAGPGAMLALVDVREDPALLLGRHDFVAGPMQIRSALVVHTSAGEPVVLAEMGGPVESATCGWWLARRPRFVCAPKIAGESRHEAYRGLLVESWKTDFPPSGLSDATRTGRLVRLSAAGRWMEVDSFRCLGRPLEQALEEAGSRGVRRWQRDAARRLTRVALYESRTFEDLRAVDLLREAISVDACDAEPWRLLGRLEFQAGRSEAATTALAAAVALDSHDPAPLVDLADALLGLDETTRSGAEAWDLTREVLARPPATRSLAERASGPTELARGLYETYLQRTAETPERHRSRRRRVEEQLQRLR